MAKLGFSKIEVVAHIIALFVLILIASIVSSAIIEWDGSGAKVDPEILGVAIFQLGLVVLVLGWVISTLYQNGKKIPALVLTLLLVIVVTALALHNARIATEAADLDGPVEEEALVQEQ